MIRCRRGIASLILSLGLFQLATTAGCASVGGPVFPELLPARVWPAPPDTARIRYIGELIGEASLKSPPHGWSAVRNALTGEYRPAAFLAPTAIAVAGQVVFVADGQLHCVHRLDLEQRTYKKLAEAEGRPLGFPIDLMIADDHLLVLDSQAPGLFEFDLQGAFLKRRPMPDVQRPSAMIRDENTGVTWITDTASHACVGFDRDGIRVARVGGRGAQQGQFNYPTGISWNRRTGICVVDAMNFRVQLLADDGAPLRCFGAKGDAAGDFALPRDIAADSEGHLYVLDNQFENIQIFDSEGQLLLAFGNEGNGPGQFNLPSGITIDNQDRIWIADTYNRRVQVFQYLRESRDGA